MLLVIEKIVQYFAEKMPELNVTTNAEDATAMPYLLIDSFKERLLENLAGAQQEIEFKVSVVNHGTSIACIADKQAMVRQCITALHVTLNGISGIRRLSSAMHNKDDLWSAEFNVVIIV